MGCRPQGDGEIGVGYRRGVMERWGGGGGKETRGGGEIGGGGDIDAGLWRDRGGMQTLG